MVFHYLMREGNASWLDEVGLSSPDNPMLSPAPLTCWLTATFNTAYSGSFSLSFSQ
jgi:hypothetical protein